MSTLIFSAGTFTPPRGYSAPDNQEGLIISLDSILSNIIGIITLVAGLAFLFYFIIGAINWITSSGDVQKIQKANQMIVNALIGITVSVAAYGIIYIISQILGVEFTRPDFLINSLFE